MSKIKAVGVSAVLAGLLGAAAVPASAHHSFPATYLVDQTVTIEGTVEWGAGGSLGSITKDTIKPGDKVIVTGNPARDLTSRRLRMRAIERPSDGWKWAGAFG